MPYTPKTWENKPSTASPINATNLNHMEGGIKTNDDNIIGAQNAILTLQGEMLQAQGDISALETLVDSIFPVDTESGNPAVITDAFGGACKSLKLTLEPIQGGSGTPSPQNVRPISGRTQSKVIRTSTNMFIGNSTDSAQYVGDYYVNDSNYNWARSSNGNYNCFQVEVVPGTAYTLCTDSGTLNTVAQMRYLDANKNFISGATNGYNNLYGTFTTPSGCLYVEFSISKASTKNYGVNYPSTITEYVPYVSTETITIQLGQTVYGGVLDVTSGVLTIDYVLQNYVWGTGAAASADLGTNTRKTWYLGYTPDLTKPMYCDVAPYLANYTSDTIHFYLGASTAIVFLPTNTANDFSFNIAYALATPTTVQLTPEEVTLLQGDNVLTTDADSIEVSYSADIALYIDKKIAEGSQNNRSLSKGGLSDEEVKEEKNEIKEEEPLTKEVR